MSNPLRAYQDVVRMWLFVATTAAALLFPVSAGAQTDRPWGDLSAGFLYGYDLSEERHGFGIRGAIAVYINEWLGIAADASPVGTLGDDGEDPTPGFRGGVAAAVGPRFYFREQLGQRSERVLFAQAQVGAAWSSLPTTDEWVRDLLIQIGGGIEFQDARFGAAMSRRQGWGARFSANYRLIAGEDRQWHQLIGLIEITVRPR